ncbi:MAG: tetratricopeptide repeat protein [Prevotella sp.]|nr:tetratricopeptide repeat protein [Prevotella sp.]
MNRKRLTILTLLLTVMVCPIRSANHQLTADSLMTLSRQCYEEDRLIEALDYATETLRQAKKERNTQTYVMGLANIAGIYGVFKDYDKAHHYFKLCLEQAQASGYEDMVARCYSNLTMTSCMLGNVDEAKRYLALQAGSRMKDAVRSRFFFLSNQGKVAAAEEQWQQAIYFAQQARDFAASHKMGLQYEASEVGEMAGVYESMGDYSKSIQLYRDMLRMASEAGDLKGASRAYDHLAGIYHLSGNSEQAAYYREQAVQLSDSVFNTRAFNGAKGRLNSFEEEQNAERISLLHVRINRQLLLIVLFVVLLVAVVLLAVGLVRRNRSLQAAYQLLVEKNKEAIRQSEETAVPTESEHLPVEQHQQLLTAIEQVMRQEDVICRPDFDLAMLCTLVGSNAKYVSWVINDHHHVSFKALLNSYRIRLASKRLADTEHYGHLTIQAVAESVGYKSQTNFIQTFKGIIGMTPSTYQKIAKGKVPKTEETDTSPV